MSALLAALRISRRDMWRAKARSALIVVMIGLPVLAVTAALTHFATRDLTFEEQVPMRLGAADARVADTRESVPIRQDVTGDNWEPRSDKPLEPRSRERIQALLGQGARVIPVRSTSDEYSAGGRYTRITVVELDLRDPMTKGMFPLLQGRYPQSADEVVVTASRKVSVGATIRYTRRGVPKHVVGRVVDQQTEYGGSLIGPPGSLFPTPSGDSHTWDTWLADLPSPPTWTETLRLNQAGLAVTSPAVLADPPSVGDGPGQALDLHMRSAWTVSGMVAAVSGIALAVIEVVLLAGPAFAVGIRRRRRELALLSAQGASARHLKLVVLADGLTLGLVAAVLGSVLGIGVARVAAAVIGIWPDGELGPFDVPVGQIALVAALGLVSGVVAAVVPAVQAARTDAVTVLAGRRPTARDRAGRPLAGLVLLVAGTATMLYGTVSIEAPIYLGGALGLLGLVMVTPWLVRRIGGLAGGLPLPLRLAARDASRNRGRTAPAVVAVLAAAAVFGTVAVGVTSSAATAARGPWPYYPQGTTMVWGDEVPKETWDRIRSLLTEAFPGTTPIETYQALDGEGRALDFGMERRLCKNCFLRSGPLRALPVGGPDLLRLLLGRTDRAAEAALAEGKAVIFDPGAVGNGEVRLNVTAFGAGGDEDPTVTMPAVGITVQGPAPVLGVAPVAAVTGAGYVPGPSGFVIRQDGARLDPERARRLRESVRALAPDAGVEDTENVESDRFDFTLWVMGALASLVVLGGTLAAAGLAAADARPDLDTLSAVGARPRTRRTVAAGQAVFVAGLGVPLGLLIGLLPGFAMASQSALQRGAHPETGFNGVAYPAPGMVFSVPWLTLVAVGVGLPLLAGLIALVFARTRVTMTRRLG
ncbi:FtsX-like permease family protein [Streptosporangium saharense]|uniref:FtsX-like permease family protein n=1 Tax=Streptosporangium saharense TaxID=1706840 RepID=UPI0036947820